MALALLDILGADPSRLRVRVDTGTNRYYQLCIGTGTTSRSGFDWIDGVVHRTPVTPNPSGGGLLDTATEVTLPLPRLPRAQGLVPQPLYVQLLTFRTPGGLGPGFSPVLPVTREVTMPTRYTDTFSITDGAPAFAPPRTVPSRTCAEQMSEPRLDDLLAQIVRVAAPVVLQLIGGGQTASSGSAPAAPAGGNALGPLVQAIAGALPSLFGALTGAPQVSHAQSLLATPAGNRFADTAQFSRPMVFGIDDALLIPLIGQVAGPLLNVLPQLVNSANQQRVQLEANRNKLVSDLVGDVERRMLLQQVLQAQQQAPAGQSADLQRLAALLQQAGASQPAGAATATPAAPVAAATSLSLAQPVSARAVATFLTAPPVTFPGGDTVLFARGRPVTLQVKLAVADPVPKSPLPKAIVRVVVKDPEDQRVLAEQVVKQHDLAANGVVPVTFTADQLATVPAARPVSLLAEIRWLLPDGSERRALGSQDAAFVDRLFVKSRGADAGPEQELTDMGRYRPFWNKVWESPVAAGGKTLWGLDVTMRYTVLLTTEGSNGLMQTKLSSPPDGTSDEIRLQTSGKMKAGIECSVDELAKLSSLWSGEQPLDADHLAAFRTVGFARRSASDAVVSVRLDGPKDERAVVWAVPVMKLVDYTLGSVTATDENGQVTAVQDEHAHFPLPTAVRVLALRSGEGSDTAGEEGAPEYHFDGYRVDHSEKVELTPRG